MAKSIKANLAAAKAVLATTELLEGILVCIDVKTLLLAQRVSRKWNEVIKRSDLLQKKLFFKPTTLDEAISTCLEFDQVCRLFFAEKDIDAFRLARTMKEVLRIRHERLRSSISSVVLLNPLLIRTDSRVSNELNPHRSDIDLFISNDASVEPSWKRMLVALPSSPPLSIHAASNTKIAAGTYSFNLPHHESASTLEEALDRISTAMERATGDSLNVRMTTIYVGGWDVTLYKYKQVQRETQGDVMSKR